MDKHNKELLTHESILNFHKMFLENLEYWDRIENIKEISFQVSGTKNSHSYLLLDIRIFNKQFCIEEYLNLKIPTFDSMAFLMFNLLFFEVSTVCQSATSSFVVDKC